jgi:hypothetical protein
MKDYIPLIIIVSLASIGVVCILVDMIIGSDEDDIDNIIVKSHKIKTEQHQDEENIEDTSIDYEDDLVINE